MNLKSIYNEILNEHNRYPSYEGKLPNPDLELEGVNPSCGDDYTIQLMVENDIITDGRFTGEGCAISKASVDMMLELMIGKKIEEALRLSSIFQNMIKGTSTEEEIQELEEAAVLENVSHMPARVKCAVLGWHTVDQMLKDKE